MKTTSSSRYWPHLQVRELRPKLLDTTSNTLFSTPSYTESLICMLLREEGILDHAFLRSLDQWNHSTVLLSGSLDDISFVILCDPGSTWFVVSITLEQKGVEIHIVTLWKGLPERLVEPITAESTNFQQTEQLCNQLTLDPPSAVFPCLQKGATS